MAKTETLTVPRSIFDRRRLGDTDYQKLIYYMMCVVNENGEVVLSLKDVEKSTGLSRQKVRRLLEVLESSPDVTVRTTTQATIKTTIDPTIKTTIKSTIIKLSNSAVKTARPTIKTTIKTTIDPTIETTSVLTPDTVFPAWVEPEYQEAWEKWLEYRKEMKKEYKSETSAHIGYRQMKKKCGDNPRLALDMIENSIACGYQGMFMDNTKNSIYGANKQKSADGGCSETQRMERIAKEVIRQSS